MKTKRANTRYKFVVVVLGYWGKGNTIGEAAGNCFKEGGGKRDECLCYRYAGQPEDLDGITVDGGGNIEYPQAVKSKQLWRIADKIRLGKAMEMATAVPFHGNTPAGKDFTIDGNTLRWEAVEGYEDMDEAEAAQHVGPITIPLKPGQADPLREMLLRGMDHAEWKHCLAT